MDFGICGGPGTNPPQIPRDNCILKAIIVHFKKMIFKKKLLILKRKFAYAFGTLGVLQFLKLTVKENLLWDWSSLALQVILFYLFIFLNLFIYFYFWLRWAFLLRVGVSLVAASGGYSSLRCAGFSLGGLSCCRARAPGARASVVVALGLSSCGSWAPEHRLSSCGTWAWLLRGMWDPPGPGLEPVSPALAGGFLTTAPPGKP